MCILNINGGPKEETVVVGVTRMAGGVNDDALFYLPTLVAELSRNNVCVVVVVVLFLFFFSLCTSCSKTTIRRFSGIARQRIQVRDFVGFANRTRCNFASYRRGSYHFCR